MTRAPVSRPVVAIVQKTLAHYRVPFFEHLRRRLDERDITLRLTYGRPSNERARRNDTRTLPWAYEVENWTLRAGRHELYWQPCRHLLRDADLVVVEQASKLLLNYVLLAWQAAGGPRLAFWGHGRNLQAHSASRVGEALKAYTSRRVHWWFAYNALSQRIVEGLGFPPDRITNVQNAIDTRRLRTAYQSTSDEEVQRLRASLGLTGANVGLFVGGMYPEKRLGFLLEACRHVRATVPDFEMLWVGAGPDASRVRDACAATEWMHYVGPKFDTDRVPYFKLASVFLMPGLVGLAILDAFSMETPLVTTDLPYHSPEIDYLIPDENGVLVPEAASPRAYAGAVVALLQDDERRHRLIEAGRTASTRYTVDDMARRFAEGLQQALPPHAPAHPSPSALS